MGLEDQVIAWLAGQSDEAYLVGGCVRDWVLGRPIYDLDVAVGGDALVLARSLANHFKGDYYPLDEARDTGRVILYGREQRRLLVDVARFRGADLASDLADRDFTINALAASVRAVDDVIDNHGGLADLRAGLIRPVSEAIIRSDPLRALRAVRQAAQLGFTLVPETQSLIRRDGAALADVSSERVCEELSRLLIVADASAFLVQLDDLGLLTIILPELEPLRYLVQPRPHHLDVLRHSFETVRALETLLAELAEMAEEAPGEEAKERPVHGTLEPLAVFWDRLRAHLAQVMSATRPRLVTLKLSALLHDVGKAAAQSVDEDGRVRFIGHEKDGAKLVGEALYRLRFSNGEVQLGETIVQHHMRPLLLANQKSVSSRSVYRFFRDTGQAGVDVLLHALADHRATYELGTGQAQWLNLVSLTARMLGDYWERKTERISPPPLVGGRDLLQELGLEPGPHIGDLLEAVREAQVSGEISTREEALELVRAKVTG